MNSGLEVFNWKRLFFKGKLSLCPLPGRANRSQLGFPPKSVCFATVWELLSKNNISVYTITGLMRTANFGACDLYSPRVHLGEARWSPGTPS